MTAHKSFGAKLRHLRGGMSQRRLAKELGSSNSELSRVEKGVKLPSPELCRQYEEFFGLPEGTVLDERNQLERGEWDPTPVPVAQGDGVAVDAVVPEAEEQRARRRKAVVLIPVALAVGVLITLLVIGNHAERATIYPGISDCITVGTLKADLAKEPGTDQLHKRLAAVYERTNDKMIGCASRPAYRWQSLVVQEMMRDRLPNGAIIISPNGADLYFNRAAWGSYHQLGGKTGNMAQTTGGVLVPRRSAASQPLIQLPHRLSPTPRLKPAP